MSEHDDAIEKMLLEARAELTTTLPHWRRVIVNDCRDDVGDIITVPEYARRVFDPPHYKVERIRWQGDVETGEPGPETTDSFAWAHESDAGYPPSTNITVGIRGTEGLFQDQICTGPEGEVQARLAAWADYDRRMSAILARKANRGG